VCVMAAPKYVEMNKIVTTEQVQPNRKVDIDMDADDDDDDDAVMLVSDRRGTQQQLDQHSSKVGAVVLILRYTYVWMMNAHIRSQ